MSWYCDTYASATGCVIPVAGPFLSAVAPGNIPSIKFPAQIEANIARIVQSSERANPYHSLQTDLPWPTNKFW